MVRYRHPESLPRIDVSSRVVVTLGVFLLSAFLSRRSCGEEEESGVERADELLLQISVEDRLHCAVPLSARTATDCQCVSGFWQGLRKTSSSFSSSSSRVYSCWYPYCFTTAISWSLLARFLSTPTPRASINNYRKTNPVVFLCAFIFKESVHFYISSPLLLLLNESTIYTKKQRPADLLTCHSKKTTFTSPLYGAYCAMTCGCTSAARFDSWTFLSLLTTTQFH